MDIVITNISLIFIRVKMCRAVTQDDLTAIHHEMGHIQYFMSYRKQNPIFRGGANAAFHEAVGDTIALSVMTPDHLKKVNLLEQDVKQTKGQYFYIMSVSHEIIIEFAFNI